MDIKPWDDEIGMKKLEESVRNVQMECLTWGACKELISFRCISIVAH
jgi:translation elongation factor EF-1beta